MPSGRSHKEQMAQMMSGTASEGGIEAGITGGQKAPELPKPKSTKDAGMKVAKVAATVMTMGAAGAVAGSALGKVATQVAKVKNTVDKYTSPSGMAAKGLNKFAGSPRAGGTKAGTKHARTATREIGKDESILGRVMSGYKKRMK